MDDQFRQASLAASAFTLTVHAADIERRFYGAPASEHSQRPARVVAVEPYRRHGRPAPGVCPGTGQGRNDAPGCVLVVHIHNNPAAHLAIQKAAGSRNNVRKPDFGSDLAKLFDLQVRAEPLPRR